MKQVQDTVSAQTCVYTVATECLLSIFCVDRFAGSLILLGIVNVLVDTWS